jgi:hypothetical protein
MEDKLLVGIYVWVSKCAVGLEVKWNHSKQHLLNATHAIRPLRGTFSIFRRRGNPRHLDFEFR